MARNNTNRKNTEVETVVEASAPAETTATTPPAAMPTSQIADKYNKDELFAKFGTKSAVIRFLHDQGYKKGQIAKFLGIIYQHVYNVLAKPLKRPADAAHEQ